MQNGSPGDFRDPSGAAEGTEQTALIREIDRAFEAHHLAQGHRPKSIQQYLAIVARFSSLYGPPWEWSRGHVERFLADLIRAGKARETIKTYLSGLKTYSAYLLDDNNGWNKRALEIVGKGFSQVVTVAAMRGLSSAPTSKRRKLKKEDVTSLFRAVRARADAATAKARKERLTRSRDYALLAALLAFGLRDSEAAFLDLDDVYTGDNANAFL